jgi:cytochrome c6
VRKLLSLLALGVFVAFVVAPAFAAEDGKALFESKCAMCHGKDGVAKSMAKGSGNFNDPAWQKAHPVDDVVKVLNEGKNKMPSFKSKLSAEQIKAVAEYIHTLK